jgi:hypothetical protein
MTLLMVIKVETVGVSEGFASYLAPVLPLQNMRRG